MYRVCQKKAPHVEIKLFKNIPTNVVSNIHLHWLVVLVLNQISHLAILFLRYCQFSDNSVSHRLATFQL